MITSDDPSVLIFTFGTLTTANVLQYSDACQSERETDAYLTYVGAQAAPLNSRKVYRLHSKNNQEQTTQIVTGIYNTQELIGAAHYFGVSLTAFLTAVMADAIFEMRKLDTDGYTSTPVY